MILVTNGSAARWFPELQTAAGAILLCCVWCWCYCCCTRLCLGGVIPASLQSQLSAAMQLTDVLFCWEILGKMEISSRPCPCFPGDNVSPCFLIDFFGFLATWYFSWRFPKEEQIISSPLCLPGVSSGIARCNGTMGGSAETDQCQCSPELPRRVFPLQTSSQGCRAPVAESRLAWEPESLSSLILHLSVRTSVSKWDFAGQWKISCC